MEIKRKAGWLFHSARWFIIRVLHVLTGRYYVSGNRYGKSSMLEPESGNQYIFDKIMSGEPFACCRFGYFEMRALINCYKDEIWGTNSFSTVRKRMKNPEQNAFNLYENDQGGGV